MSSLLYILLFTLVQRALAQYQLVDDYSGDNFFPQFDFFSGADPTHGIVKYVTESDARQRGLISTPNGVAHMGVDSTNVVGDEGRPSVRIESKKAYNKGLIIADFAHVPGSACGTWPAFWTYGPGWPNGGEIDIYEGVHMTSENGMALHTGPGCSVNPTAGFSGQMITDDCYVSAPDQAANQGCQIDSNNPSSFGTALNDIGGGVFATEWTAQGIKIWFFPRSGIPADIANKQPNPAGWGTAAGYFAGNCNFDTMFVDQRIVFDTTFCGDWAGNVWNTEPECRSKAPSCNEFVKGNPTAFAQSYWDVNHVRVYQNA
ncbi:hypothetical protein AJ80_01121 [Polytolypa hystricis UAMH7299]|uniref:endo-1,3(4)-beta-glucanase n=1 Tax=Polytolypa hystricis (strain UAMH7299) TaxID=1447883 RepID=A0A2B7YT00_POLH7|nr:hypothetical protein AJ80_01121 [Polytolypa hystricis UAMH7299]